MSPLKVAAGRLAGSRFADEQWWWCQFSGEPSWAFELMSEIGMLARLVGERFGGGSRYSGT